MFLSTSALTVSCSSSKKYHYIRPCVGNLPGASEKSISVSSSCLSRIHHRLFSADPPPPGSALQGSRTGETPEQCSRLSCEGSAVHKQQRRPSQTRRSARQPASCAVCWTFIIYIGPAGFACQPLLNSLFNGRRKPTALQMMSSYTETLIYLDYRYKQKNYICLDLSQQLFLGTYH